MDEYTEKVVYGSNLTVLSFSGVAKIPTIYGGYGLITETSEDLLSENDFNLITEDEVTSINIRVGNSDLTSYKDYSFPLQEGQILTGNDYIDDEGLHIDGNLIAFTFEQSTAFENLQNIPLYEGISHIVVTDTTPAVLKFSYYSNEGEDNQVYVLNKNENLLAIFSKGNEEDVLINPRVEKRQNAESIFTFTIDTKNPKWGQINNPENLYLVDGMIFSTNFDGSFKEKITENDEKTIEVIAYERQQLLSRKFVRAWNSETNLEKIDNFMVVILSNGNLPLRNNGVEVTSRYPKGSSGYALEALLYGTDWTVGTCDIYEYENGQIVKDQNNNPVYAKFDLETDQVNIYDNILKVQELWGGILVFDSMNKIVHHRDETLYLPYNGYEVKYQKNMQSLEKEYNNKIITKLCPLGEGGLNIASVNNNSIWLENYTYTNTVLEGIENNPDIKDSTQLKRWGQRKLEMICRPSIELNVNVALLYQVEGYELEKVDLNDIVDIINYNDIDRDYVQLRVVEFSYSLWDKTDAIVKLSNITLDSTDIFRQTVTATNSINAGTLDAARVITLYKGGQSVEKTMFNMDGIVQFNYSTLMTEDTGIVARVTHTEDEYNTLSGEVGKHTREIGELNIKADEISSTVSNIQIGGTNLIKNSGDFNVNLGVAGGCVFNKEVVNESTAISGKVLKAICTTAVNDYAGFFLDGFPYDIKYEGKTMTWSYYAKASRNITRIHNGLENNGLTDVAFTTEWKKYTHTFTYQRNPNDYHAFIFYARATSPYQVGDVVYIRDWKLEEGNKATTWNDSIDAPTKTEMTSAITETANAINVEVNKKINESTITGAYLVLKINGDNSSGKLRADKVDISANDILNLLAGNQINLTSKNITIQSNNFSVDANGNVTMNNADISGNVEALTGSIGNFEIRKGGLYTINSDDIRTEINENGFHVYYQVPNTSVVFDLIKISYGISGINYNPTEITETKVKAQELETYFGKVPQIIHFKTTITPSAPNTPTGVTVTLSKSFSGTPTVVATPTSGAVGTQVTGVGVSGITTNSFSVYLTRTNTTATEINVVAMY